MINDKIKCCHLFDNFVRQYRDKLCMELTLLDDSYVFELRGNLHLEDTGGSFEGSSCQSGCISCGPPKKEEPKDKWHVEPLELVWKHCPFCGGNFVRD